MGFNTTTHDRTVYISFYKPNGETIYLLIKVYDFSISCYNEYLSKDIYNQIGVTLQLPIESDEPFAYLGHVTDFNGIDIEQSRDYIQIYYQNYMDRVMIYHRCNWEKSKVPDKSPSRIPPNSLKQLFIHYVPKEGTK